MAVRIVQMTWRTAPDAALVLDPAGTVWELSARSADARGPYVDLIDPERPANRIRIYPNPDDAVSVLTGANPGPIATLSMYFQLERIG